MKKKENPPDEKFHIGAVPTAPVPRPVGQEENVPPVELGRSPYFDIGLFWERFVLPSRERLSEGAFHFFSEGYPVVNRALEDVSVGEIAGILDIPRDGRVVINLQDGTARELIYGYEGEFVERERLIEEEKAQVDAFIRRAVDENAFGLSIAARTWFSRMRSGLVASLIRNPSPHILAVEEDAENRCIYITIQRYMIDQPLGEVVTGRYYY